MLGEFLQGDTIKFLEMMNENQAREIAFLHAELRHQREMSSRMLEKIIGREQTKVNIETMEPIGGFKSLRMKIAEAEAESLKEYNRMMENADKE